MKRLLALGGVLLALVGVIALSGCQARDRAGRQGSGTGPAATSQQPGAPGRPIDVDTVDRDLSDVDALLTETDKQLSGADASPVDAD